eukprot:Lithocolla_globosa_v1_NODE_165_length_5553_cov_13.632479.p2 type:complete len:334 gc:universal NODE_165_length_5553_cov_13.632479:3268-2267(-)
MLDWVHQAFGFAKNKIKHLHVEFACIYFRLPKDVRVVIDKWVDHYLRIDSVNTYLAYAQQHRTHFQEVVGELGGLEKYYWMAEGWQEGARYEGDDHWPSFYDNGDIFLRNVVDIRFARYQVYDWYNRQLPQPQTQPQTIATLLYHYRMLDRSLPPTHFNEPVCPAAETHPWDVFETDVTLDFVFIYYRLPELLRNQVHEWVVCNLINESLPERRSRYDKVIEELEGLEKSYWNEGGYEGDNCWPVFNFPGEENLLCNVVDLRFARYQVYDWYNRQLPQPQDITLPDPANVLRYYRLLDRSLPPTHFNEPSFVQGLDCGFYYMLDNDGAYYDEE